MDHCLSGLELRLPNMHKHLYSMKLTCDSCNVVHFLTLNTELFSTKRMFLLNFLNKSSCYFTNIAEKCPVSKYMATFLMNL